jgi:hypothetical protein
MRGTMPSRNGHFGCPTSGLKRHRPTGCRKAAMAALSDANLPNVAHVSTSCDPAADMPAVTDALDRR